LVRIFLRIAKTCLIPSRLSSDHSLFSIFPPYFQGSFDERKAARRDTRLREASGTSADTTASYYGSGGGDRSNDRERGSRPRRSEEERGGGLMDSYREKAKEHERKRTR
jgi:hypothetical protein